MPTYERTVHVLSSELVVVSVRNSLNASGDYM